MCELTDKLRSYNKTSGYSTTMIKAADLIDEQRDAMNEASKIIIELCQTFGVPTPDSTIDRLKSHCNGINSTAIGLIRRYRD